MTKEQHEHVLAYLKEQGFDGAALEASLTEGISSQVPSFRIRHQLNFGEEKMRFVLRFERDLQFEAYRLTGYEATHVSAVKLKHKEVNGVDTAALEQRMATIDWANYFRWRERFGYPKQRSDIAEIMLHLNQLAADSNSSGREIQQKLIFKYWPEAARQDPEMQELKTVYEYSREFQAGQSKVCHANLAHIILSGKLDDLHEHLSKCGLEALAPDLYNELAQHLVKLPDTFEVIRETYSKEGHAEISVEVNHEPSGEYTASQYTVKLTVYPEIQHGIYNGIDTLELEQKIMAIDWQDIAELTTGGDESDPQFKPHVQDVSDALYSLIKDPEGVTAAHLLVLKYASPGNVLDLFADTSTWDYEASLPTISHQFPIEVPVTVACNLLYGRAVPEDYLIPCVPSNDHWTRLDLSNRRSEGDYPMKAAGVFPNGELVKRLSLLPAENFRLVELKERLLLGEKAMLKLRTGLEIQVEAVPEQKTIRLYSTDGRPIPFNLEYSPDWSLQQQPAEQLRTKASRGKHHRHKGR